MLLLLPLLLLFCFCLLSLSISSFLLSFGYHFYVHRYCHYCHHHHYRCYHYRCHSLALFDDFDTNYKITSTFQYFLHEFLNLKIRVKILRTRKILYPTFKSSNDNHLNTHITRSKWLLSLNYCNIFSYSFLCIFARHAHFSYALGPNFKNSFTKSIAIR